MKKSLYYRCARGLLKLFYPYAKVLYEQEPAGPGVFVCNHAGMNGPVMTLLNLPRKHQTWAVSYAMDPKKCARFAFHDFFAGNSRKHPRFWRVISGIVGKLLPPLLQNADTIPVHHNGRIIQTFKESLAALEDGSDIVIFAESPARFSEFVNELHAGFADLGRLYQKTTGKPLYFYPTYLSKRLKTIAVARPVAYDPARPPGQQREEISRFVRDGIDRMARLRPKHRPVPFLPERWYRAYGQYEHQPAEYWNLFED